MSEKIDIEVLENGKLIYNPYNANNIEITEKELKLILKSYGLPPKIYNINLYKRAFVHKSYVKKPKIENSMSNIEIVDKPDNCLALKQISNERLEFLGDGILEAITKFYLYKRFPKENEGFMTEKKIGLVKNESLGRLAYNMNLNKWLLLSKHAEDKKSRTNLKKLGCLFEAFLAAIYLDYSKLDVNDSEGWFKNLFKGGPGFQMCQVFLENVYERHVNWTDLIMTDDNYKNILQVKIQKEFKVTPLYLEIDNDYEIGYTMGVYLSIGNNQHELNPVEAIEYDAISLQNIKEESLTNPIFILLGESTHKIKKKAEQMACMQALNKIN